MIVAAPAARPGITAAMPTAPVPKTAMLDPAPTSNALRTALAPVVSPQLRGASNSVPGMTESFSSGSVAECQQDQ
jgi:hypothetical protein